MTRDDHCPRCGTRLEQSTSPEGLCPACLMQQALEEFPSTDGELQSTEAVGEPASKSRTIGPYRLLQKLGEGGMGEVWAAEQSEPVRRKVALKLIKRGMDTKQVIARFESERQAVALMDHPAIAHVFEAGATQEGRPYFAMELVRGVPITEHCDRHRLNTEERLKLFMQVCEGVQHAHQKGIIHRDIKPSNVLVTIDGEKAVPKIIDFGVAKATEQRLTERSLFTELGVLIGTPEYMSPEQADLTAQDIDTRTDVYSLGVLLYQLLAGALPFDSKELRQAGYEEIRRKVREDDPPKPSTRLSTLGGEESTEAAKARRTDPSSLRRQLCGDLDWISMRALEKDRTRRYGSPTELAADVQRHLVHEPVLAGPPSAGYRAKKFVRRHRTGVGFAAVLLLVLIGFAVTMTLQAGRIARERDRANEEAERASREAETSNRVSEFMVRLFEIPDPGEARGKTVTAAEILDRGSEQIERGLKDEPVIRARLMATMGKTYSNLGLFEPARGLLEQSLAIREQHLFPDHPETATNLLDLGILAAFRQDYEEALDLGERSLAIRRKVLEPDDPVLAFTLDGVGDVHRNLGDRDQFKNYVKEAQEVWDRIGEDPDSTDWRLALHYVQYAYAQDRPEDARPFLLKAVEVFERSEEEEAYWPVIVHTPVYRLAKFYAYGLKDYEPAVPLFQRSLERAQRFYGPGHNQTAELMVHLGGCLRRLGRYDEALPLLERGLAALEKVFGPEHRSTVSAMRALCILLLVTGETEKARPLYRRALEAWSTGRHDTLLEHTIELADLVRDAGEYDDALKLYEIVIDLGEAQPDGSVYGVPYRTYLKTALNRSAELLRWMGRDDEAAQQEARAAVETQSRPLPESEAP